MMMQSGFNFNVFRNFNNIQIQIFKTKFLPQSLNLSEPIDTIYLTSAYYLFIYLVVEMENAHYSKGKFFEK